MEVVFCVHSVVTHTIEHGTCGLNRKTLPFFYVTGENKTKKVETFPVFSTIFSCSLIKESGSFYLAEL